MSCEPILRYGPFTRLKIFLKLNTIQKPLSSQVLTSHLKRRKPFWSSYFVRYDSVVNDQFGYSHFNWSIGEDNYHVLRIGCYPFIKYHCSRRPKQDLSLENRLFTLLKVINFGIPTLMYGMSALFLIKTTETVETVKGDVVIYFYDKEVTNNRF